MTATAVKKDTRLWEVDTFRGIAIVLMVFYHLMWDVFFFGLADINVLSPEWQAFARTIATMFIFTMGVSLTLSYNSYLSRHSQPPPFSKFFWRGVQVFGYGLLITVGTYFFLEGRGYVIFGILHLLGFTIMIAYPFLRFNRWLTLAIGVAAIGAGIYLNTLVVDHPWLIWLGVVQRGSFMVDYYPVLPWAGVGLIGIFAGYSLYPEGFRSFSLPNLGDLAPLRGLQFLGRHSLLIYLIHQPILIGLFFALGFASFG